MRRVQPAAIEPPVAQRGSLLYVLGGQQRRPRPLSAGNRLWEGYDTGVIVEVNPSTGDRNAYLEHATPAHLCAAEDPEILFQSGTVSDGKLYACTGTEVITYSLPEFQQVGYLSLPWFNDVHHVRPWTNGSLLVASAGLDLVLQVGSDGKVQRIWNVLGEDPWERFSPDTDYRLVGSTKPHRSHPNYIFCIDDDIWVTRFHQSDAVCLTGSGRIQISGERIHDGIVYGDHVYFTSVNGTIVVASTKTLQVEEVIDLTAMHPKETLLGWCRGILLDGDKMWVGYSRIRPTKARENVAWLMRRFKHVRGTHIACYDLNTRTCITEIDLESAGLNAVFSIFQTP